MMNENTTPPPDESVPDGQEWEDKDFGRLDPDDDVPGPPRPVNWNLLLSHDLEQEWLALNRWIEWLRRTYALPA